MGIKTQQFQVNFVGEGAIDHGGPKREFFRQLASEIYFKGATDTCRFFDNNMMAVQVN